MTSFKEVRAAAVIEEDYDFFCSENICIQNSIPAQPPRTDVSEIR